ncbi:MAG: hypothetical protein J7L54_05520 [Elusimicrobia bacterium]|nr:hypothetical protein [Elusimicrobiota bacterium]
MLKVKNKILYLHGKKVGIITRDGKFITFRDEKKHLYRMYDAWGFSKEVIDFLDRIGVLLVEVATKRKIYRILLGEIMKYGIKHRNPKDKNELQILVPRKFFRTIEIEAKKETQKTLKEVIEK